ncbi:hypothetical protein A6J60_002685 [Psychrobacter sp. FDAARGOS_221]|nr:hypothetical protein A6J60_002685 [Psychrobacter sp. FDAARGOS_221]
MPDSQSNIKMKRLSVPAYHSNHATLSAYKMSAEAAHKIDYPIEYIKLTLTLFYNLFLQTIK